MEAILIRRELTDVQWPRISGLIPGKEGDKGRTGEDNRLFLDAALWILRAVLDGAGRPLRILLTAGQVHEATQASDHPRTDTHQPYPDKEFDTDNFRDELAAAKVDAVIPPGALPRSPMMRMHRACATSSSTSS